MRFCRWLKIAPIVLIALASCNSNSGVGESLCPSSTAPCVTTSADAYATQFDSAENPLNEDGKWVTGKKVGLDWNDAQSSAGRAYASALSGTAGSRYDDSIAHLSVAFRQFNPNQYAQGTVYRASGYDPSPSKHEVELHLRWQTTEHNAHGYEVIWGITGYLAIVRWNGPLGNYTSMFDSGDPGIGAPRDGDVLRAQITGNTIAVYKNGKLVRRGDVGSIKGNVWTAGQPGMGFWPVDSASKEKFGWKNFEAGSL